MIGYLDLTLPTIVENLALDEALLLEAEAGRAGQVLRFWELPSFAVVLGSSGSLAEDVLEQACEADGVPIARRCSGGGTVVLGPGCLVFTLILSMEQEAALRDVTHSYAYILKRVADALDESVRPAGTSDLAIGDRKVSGNSQRRMRTHLLHHGTLLHAFNVDVTSRYLQLPRRQPAYRAGRSHAEFLRNFQVSATTLRQRVQAAWEAEASAAAPLDLVTSLVREKYGCAEWIRRR